MTAGTGLEPMQIVCSHGKKSLLKCIDFCHGCENICVEGLGSRLSRYSIRIEKLGVRCQEGILSGVSVTTFNITIFCSYRWRAGSGVQPAIVSVADEALLESRRIRGGENMHDRGKSKGSPVLVLVEVAVDRRPAVPYLVSAGRAWRLNSYPGLPFISQPWRKSVHSCEIKSEWKV